jgi:hypothetical protein
MRHLNIEDCAHISNLGVQQFKLRVLQAGPVPQGRTAIHRSYSSAVIFI